MYTIILLELSFFVHIVNIQLYKISTNQLGTKNSHI
jgi:hypothetical protein